MDYGRVVGKDGNDRIMKWRALRPGGRPKETWRDVVEKTVGLNC